MSEIAIVIDRHTLSAMLGPTMFLDGSHQVRHQHALTGPWNPMNPKALGFPRKPCGPFRSLHHPGTGAFFDLLPDSVMDRGWVRVLLSLVVLCVLVFLFFVFCLL